MSMSSVWCCQRGGRVRETPSEPPPEPPSEPPTEPPGDPAREPLRFRELYDRHGEELRRFARRIVGSREAAEDVVQDVFLRLWRGWGRVEIGSGTRAYLFIATRARALSYLKRERSEQRRGASSVACVVIAEASAFPTEGDAVLRADAISIAIDRVLATMPARQREVATLRLRDRASTLKIAQRLGISPRTVETHIARATRALRGALPALLDD